MRLEISGSTATFYGLNAQSIGAEQAGSVAALREEIITLTEEQIAEILNREELPLTIQNSINNLLRSGVQFVLGSDAPGDTYFRSASGPLARLGVGANGKILTVKTGLPSWEDAASAVAWSDVTGTSQTGAINSGYLCNNAALVTVSLPATAGIGSILEVVGKGLGGWKLAQSAGQQIHFGNISSTAGTGGSLNSTHQRDAIRLVNVIPDTTWQVVGAQGNIDVT